MIVLQLVIYCLIFTLMVRFAVRGGAIDGLYFYPKDIRDRAIDLGLTTKESINRKRKIFMTEFYVIMLVTLVLIIGLWNHISDFKTAYLYALIFLEVMNWYDGIFIDELWVRYSKFWVLPGCEDMPYVQTIGQMLKKRIFLSLIWVAGATIVAGLVVVLDGLLLFD